MSDDPFNNVVNGLRRMGMNVQPTPLKGLKRGPDCEWPWPYQRLSNGFELEVQEHLAVRSLVDAHGYQHGKRKPPTIKKGDRVGITVAPFGTITLVKYSSSQYTKWNEIIQDAKEGVHFELIEGEKISLPDIRARKLINKSMKPADALARAKRELDERGLREIMTPSRPEPDLMGMFGKF
jgi:bifunctional DNA-binding transcriptional regulator/antitoxin component of YhaV-PrlF toxin-antitoxin module